MPPSFLFASENTGSHPGSFERAAKIVGVYVGAAYASGFLVVSTYLQRLGVREALPDLIRLRYIHVGVLCLLLPAFVVPAAYLQYKTGLSGWKRLYSESDREPITALAEILAGTMGLLMAVILCELLEFSTFAWYKLHAGTILVFWSTILLLIVLIYKYPRFDRTPFTPTLFRCLITAAGLAFGGKLIWMSFIDFHFPTAVSVLTYLVIVGVCASYVLLIISEEPSTHSQGVFILRVVLLIGLYYLSVLAFANLIFPNILAERGGGSLDDLENVQLCMDYNSILPEQLANKVTPAEATQRLAVDPNGKNTYGVATCSIPVKLIEQTAGTSVVVTDGGGKKTVYVLTAKANLVFSQLKNDPWERGQSGLHFEDLSRRFVGWLVLAEVIVLLAILLGRKGLVEYQRKRSEAELQQSLNLL
jgi:hypothetical protein